MVVNSLGLLQKRVNADLDSKRITKAELCRRAGIARTTLDRLLEGEQISLETMEGIAKALDKSPWDLIRPDNVKISPSEALAIITEAIKNPLPNVPENVLKMLAKVHPDDWDAIEAVLRGLTENGDEDDGLEPGTTVHQPREKGK